MWAAITIWYDLPVAHNLYMQYVSHAGIYSGCGVVPGCDWATYVYVRGTKAATRDIHQCVQSLSPYGKMRVYLHEGYIWAKKEQFAEMARILEARGVLAHLHLQPTKLKVWLPDGTTLPAVWEMGRVTTRACLGDNLRIAGGQLIRHLSTLVWRVNMLRGPPHT